MADDEKPPEAGKAPGTKALWSVRREPPRQLPTQDEGQIVELPRTSPHAPASTQPQSTKHR